MGSEKSNPGGGGNYAREANRVLTTFIDWTPDSVGTVRDVSRRTMMQYAEHLHRRADARVADPDDEAGITGRTAQQYYALVRTFFTYCAKWGYREENPAEHKPAMEELPDASLAADSNHQQFWSPRERTAFIQEITLDHSPQRDTHGRPPRATCGTPFRSSLVRFKRTPV